MSPAFTFNLSQPSLDTLRQPVLGSSAIPSQIATAVVSTAEMMDSVEMPDATNVGDVSPKTTPEEPTTPPSAKTGVKVAAKKGTPKSNKRASSKSVAETPAKKSRKLANKGTELEETEKNDAPKKKAVKKDAATNEESEKVQGKVGDAGDRRPIPNSLEDADEADTLLWTMKENKEMGKDIVAAMAKVGVHMATHSIAARYARMKAKLMRFAEGDVGKFRLALTVWETSKQDKIKEIERTKFAFVSDIMANNFGTAKYAPDFLGREFRKMSTAAGADNAAANMKSLDDDVPGAKTAPNDEKAEEGSIASDGAEKGGDSDEEHEAEVKKEDDDDVEA